MHARLERLPGQAERNDLIGVIVHDRYDVGTRLIDRSVDRPLEIHGPPTLVDRVALKIVFHDVVELDELGAARTGQKEAIRPIGTADAHVPKRVRHAFACEDVVRHHKVAPQRVEIGHCKLSRWDEDILKEVSRRPCSRPLRSRASPRMQIAAPGVRPPCT